MMFRSEAGTVKSADSDPGHHSDCGLSFQSSRQKDNRTIEVRRHACKLGDPDPGSGMEKNPDTGTGMNNPKRIF
jgi:hypothetical protein